MRPGTFYPQRGPAPFWVWGPVLLYIGFILWVSSSPRPIPGIQRFPWLDKPLHAAEYAPLGMLLLRAVSRSFWRGDSGWGRWHLLAISVAVAVGVLDEWYQHFVPLKNPSAWDALADGTGAAVGQLLYATRARSAKTP